MSLPVIAEEASFVLGRQMATDWVSERLAGGWRRARPGLPVLALAVWAMRSGSPLARVAG